MSALSDSATLHWPGATVLSCGFTKPRALFPCRGVSSTLQSEVPHQISLGNDGLNLLCPVFAPGLLRLRFANVHCDSTRHVTAAPGMLFPKSNLLVLWKQFSGSSES
jgi:hypothetical protein